MGSSAASAAAGAWAVNSLFGGKLTKEQLVIPGLTSEATVSGYHADNIAPALLGGFILIRYHSERLPRHRAPTTVIHESLNCLSFESLLRCLIPRCWQQCVSGWPVFGMQSSYL